MKVLHPTPHQHQLIDGLSYKSDIVRFSQDFNNNWVNDISNRTNVNFKNIIVDDNGVTKTAFDILNELVEIDFVKPIIND